MPWTEPRARMAEYVAVLQALFEAFRTGDAVHYEGDAYRVTRLQPYFNPGPKDIEPPRIWLGAVNAGMSELAGRTAHGVVTHSTNSDPDYLRDVVRPALGRGAQDGGRADQPLIVVSTAIATGDSDAAVAQERERATSDACFSVVHAGVCARAQETGLDRIGRPTPHADGDSSDGANCPRCSAISSSTNW